MKLKKSLSLILAGLMLASAVSGCGGNNKIDGKINLSIGNWPGETSPEALETQNKKRDEFMAENPDINIIPDTYVWDSKTFTMKALAKQLPNMYWTRFTEIQSNIRDGYAADITDQMKEHGFDVNMNPDLLKLVTGKDGKYYGVPTDAYQQALYINKDLFKQAGLVNENGSIKEPDSWQELAEYSQIIKEKTGKAGFALPTTNNCGGWMFLNIAWDFGTEFEKQRDDGTWEATFNTDETKAALQYIKDLKWKYNALLDDSVISQDDMYKYFGSGQVAMMIRDVPWSGYRFGMPIESLFATRMPKGPAGRYTQMGGNVWMFSANSTPEQIDAGLKWLEFIGYGPEMTDDQFERYKSGIISKAENHDVILEKDSYDVWVNPDTLEKKKTARREFLNADYNDYKNYFEADDIEVKLEPTACAQQLYSVLDGCIQEVITNKDADVDKLIEVACKDFQTNHLDKM